MAKRSRPHVTSVPDPTSRPATGVAEIPVVGGREPCPCGSGKRYKACHGRRDRALRPARVERPFDALPGAADWVALREIVPAATATARTTAEHGSREVLVVTVLPMAWPALHRADGLVMLALQTTATGSVDPSRELAAALLAALAAEPGTPVPQVANPQEAPRLQEVLDTGVPLEVRVHEGFDFWLAEGQEQTAEVRASLERANASVVPTTRLASVPAAYWCRIGDRRHLRWVLPEPEEALLDAIARLHARGESSLGEGSRYLGAFRAHGLLVPVWDLPATAEPGDVEAPAVAFDQRLHQALAETAPLTAQERRARAGVVSRQVTLR